MNTYTFLANQLAVGLGGSSALDIGKTKYIFLCSSKLQYEVNVLLLTHKKKGTMNHLSKISTIFTKPSIQLLKGWMGRIPEAPQTRLTETLTTVEKKDKRKFKW